MSSLRLSLRSGAFRGSTPSRQQTSPPEQRPIIAKTAACLRPIPEALRQQSFEPLTPGKGTVYLAGPFFDIGQRWLVEEANDYLLEMGANVFSPVHEVGPGPADIVAPEDIKGLERSDVVFAILNGMDPGTIFEVGYAVKKGIPVVGLAQNVRLEDLKMMEGTGCEIHSDFASAIYRAIWALPA